MASRGAPIFRGRGEVDLKSDTMLGVSVSSLSSVSSGGWWMKMGVGIMLSRIGCHDDNHADKQLEHRSASHNLTSGTQSR